MPESIVCLEEVDVHLGDASILQNINLSIEAGEFIVILGPNGAGKTTLLKVLLGLVQPTSGRVQVLGASPRRGQREIGYIPQHRDMDAEFGLRGRDLVAFGLDGHRWGIGLPSRSRREKIDRALKEVDALELAEAPFEQLSGGEQKRLLIAQALLTDPHLLLLDEPLADLDLAYQKETVALMDKVCRTRGVTVLLVSHDINPLLQATDRVLFIAHGHAAIGAPDEVITSATLTQLYRSPVEVVHTLGRYFVVGAEI
ncbi:MAG TPA: ATP-binding cassette domain-containing protein [Anaerolineales bacterium]|nr:ATP-binding cassette domain-containing protein [Anaerolineales bacterium]